MFRSALRHSLAALLSLALAVGLAAQSNTAASPRLYVLDGGVLASETARYRLTDADVEETALSVASFLIVHPRGVLMWAGFIRAGGIVNPQCGKLMSRNGRSADSLIAP